MGCDIHGWVEHCHEGKWVATSEFTDLACARNYERFNLLARVRGEEGDPAGIKARGIPANVSDTVCYHIQSWGEDGHSHSWLRLSKALPIFMQTEHREPDQAKWGESYALWRYFGVEREGLTGSDWRIVFWFDN